MKKHSSQMFLAISLSSALALSLISCATTTPTNVVEAEKTTPNLPVTPKPEKKTAQTPSKLPFASQSALGVEQIHSWNAHGAIAGNDGNKAWSATVYWKQRSADNYALQLFGPVGVGTIKINGSPSSVSLVTSKGDRFQASSAETLLAKQTGWKVPVSNLFYWIRGLAVPGMAANKSYDNDHRLNHLEQDGWSIEYLNYSTVKGVVLPSKITLSNPPHSIKIVIKEWQW